MICHVCQQPASGQCRDCLKFYCPNHGDGRCAPCGSSPAATPPGREAVAPVFVVPAEKCFRCGAPAWTKCDQCGKNHFCQKHGFGYAGGSGDTVMICNECKQVNIENQWILNIGCAVIGIVIAIIIIMGREGRFR